MTSTRYVGALDQGTTGTRFVVFDRSGRTVATAFTRHTRQTPRPGWVEFDPREIWGSAADAIRRALSLGDIRPQELAALGVTNQRQTVALWERDTGRPVGNAIGWQDRRTADRMATLDDEQRALIRERTGLEPDAYLTAPKVEWLLEEAGGDGRSRAASGELCCGTIDAWLVYNLTGEHVTDVTNAAQTMLFDIEALAWDPDLLAMFGVPEDALPEVRPSSDDGFGVTDGRLLGAEVPVAGVLGDQQAALVGQACFEAGETKVTYGSGTFLLQNTGKQLVRSEHGLLSTICFQRAGESPEYALEGPAFTTGTALEWLETVNVLGDAEETEQLARGVDSSEGVYVVPAFAGLGAPYWDATARATVVGLSADTRRGHVVRATFEAIAFQTRAVVEALAADTGRQPAELLVDGGAVNNDFFCQLQADLVGSTLVRPSVHETTALGSAYAAGLAVGFWETPADLRRLRPANETFEPRGDPDAVAARYRDWSDLVERVRGLYPVERS